MRPAAASSGIMVLHCMPSRLSTELELAALCSCAAPHLAVSSLLPSSTTMISYVKAGPCLSRRFWRYLWQQQHDQACSTGLLAAQMHQQHAAGTSWSACQDASLMNGSVHRCQDVRCMHCACAASCICCMALQAASRAYMRSIPYVKVSVRVPGRRSASLYAGTMMDSSLVAGLKMEGHGACSRSQQVLHNM